MKRLLTVVVLLLVVILPCAAGPNDKELYAYRLLVQDNTETNGGLMPVISPDGSYVAYYSNNESYAHRGDVYIISTKDFAATLNPNITPIPQKLDYNDPAGNGTMDLSEDGFDSRNIDWSPHSNRLAFIGRGEHLYLANDAGKTTVKVQAIALAADSSLGIHTPRWSPDGTKIAYVRNGGTGLNKVCIIDVNSGQETILATDAVTFPFVWNQPWSPDGKSIVYAGGKGQLNLNVGIQGKSTKPKSSANSNSSDDKPQSYIAIVSTDGKTSRKLENTSGGTRPSWSPKGNLIAFAAPAAFTIKLPSGQEVIGDTMAIYTTDIQGKQKKAIADTPQPSKDEATAYAAVFNKALRSNFEEEFASKLTTNQLKRLKSGEMTSKEMSDIADTIVSRETGIDLKKIRESKKLPDSESMEAFTKAKQHYFKTMQEVGAPFMFSLISADMDAAWSPDGKSIAFSRTMPMDNGYGQLLIKNMQTGTVKTLFDQASISCFSWTQDSKSIAVQTRRTTARRVMGEDYESPRTFGKPEIWILGLK